MKQRRYTVGFDNPMMSGYARHWPKARAVARADEIVESMGGSVVVVRMEHGVLNCVYERYLPVPTSGGER